MYQYKRIIIFDYFKLIIVNIGWIIHRFPTLGDVGFQPECEDHIQLLYFNFYIHIMDTVHRSLVTSPQVKAETSQRILRTEGHSSKSDLQLMNNFKFSQIPVLVNADFDDDNSLDLEREQTPDILKYDFEEQKSSTSPIQFQPQKKAESEVRDTVRTRSKKVSIKGNNFYSVIKNKALVRKFIKTLIQRAYVKANDSKLVGQLLDDYNQTPQEDNLFQPKVQVKGQSFIQLFNKLFGAQSELLLAWDLLQILTIVIIFVYYPYKASFGFQNSIDVGIQVNCEKMELYFIVVLAVDIVWSSRRTYIFKGQIVTSKVQIVSHYCRTSLVNDLVSLSSVVIIYVFGDIQYLLLICLFIMIFCVSKLYKINQIIERLTEFYSMHHTDVIGIVKMLVSLIFVAHLIACLWHAIAFYSSRIEETWLYHQHIENADNFTKYNYSFYWAIMTMATVGYGDITPTNNRERLFTNGIMLISCGVFGFTINSIGIVLQNIYRSKLNFKKTITMMNKYMQKNRIKFELQTRIRSYLEYIHQEEQDINDEEITQTVGKLSKKLQDELQYHLRGNILKCFKVFDRFSTQTIMSLTQHMVEVRFSPEEVIIQEAVHDDQSLYIIQSGEIGIKCGRERPSFKNKIKKLGAGSMFGELSFFTGEARTATAISVGFSKLFKIRREEFLTTIQRNPADQVYILQKKETTKYIKDQLIFNKDFDILDLLCYCCQQETHISKHCPRLHFEVDKERVIKQLLFNVIHERQRFARRPKDQGTFQDLQNKQMKVIDLQNHLIEQINQETSMDNSQSMDDIQFSSVSKSYVQQYSQISKSKSLKRTVSAKPDKAENSFHVNDDIFNDSQGSISNFFLDDNQKNVIRKTEQKRTFATAGFGYRSSMKDSQMSHNHTNKDMQIIDEKSSEQDPNSVSNHSREFQTPPQPARIPFKRSWENKMTFQLQGTDDVQSSRFSRQKSAVDTKRQAEAVRQNSRSQTYSQVTLKHDSDGILHRAESNTRQAQGSGSSINHITSPRRVGLSVSSSNYVAGSQTQQTPSMPSAIRHISQQSISQHGSHMALLKSDFENLQNFQSPHEQPKFMRVNSRKKSTMTKSVKTANNSIGLSKVDRGDGRFESSYGQEEHDWGIEGFEKMMEYRIYFQHYNHEAVVKRYNSLLQMRTNKALRNNRSFEFSQYTFDFAIAKKTEKLKRILMGLETLKGYKRRYSKQKRSVKKRMSQMVKSVRSSLFTKSVKKQNSFLLT